jgi:hypothetical protein
VGIRGVDVQLGLDEVADADHSQQLAVLDHRDVPELALASAAPPRSASGLAGA